MPRQGPGTAGYTKKAFSRLRNLPEQPRILDIGCGTGAQTLVLANESIGDITAVDIFKPILNDLKKKARETGLGDRIHPVKGSMDELDFAAEFFDVIWSEGTIYLIGFADGMK